MSERFKVRTHYKKNDIFIFDELSEFKEDITFKSWEEAEKLCAFLNLWDKDKKQIIKHYSVTCDDCRHFNKPRECKYYIKCGVNNCACGLFHFQSRNDEEDDDIVLSKEDLQELMSIVGDMAYDLYHNKKKERR